MKGKKIFPYLIAQRQEKGKAKERNRISRNLFGYLLLVVIVGLILLFSIWN